MRCVVALGIEDLSMIQKAEVQKELFHLSVKIVKVGAGTAVKIVKPLPVVLAFLLNVGSSPACPTSDSVPCLKKAARSLGPCTHKGDLEKLLV